MLDKKTPAVPEQLDQVFSQTNFEKDREYMHVFPHEEPHTRRREAIYKKYKD